MAYQFTEVGKNDVYKLIKSGKIKCENMNRSRCSVAHSKEYLVLLLLYVNHIHVIDRQRDPDAKTVTEISKTARGRRQARLKLTVNNLFIF